MKNQLLYLLLALALFACNKDKFYSKRLMRGDTWLVQSIKINDTLSEISGSWEITQKVNIYDSVPRIFWSHNNDDAILQWQFHEKAKKFYLNYLVQCEECEPNTLDTLDYLANALSGTYDVKQRSSKTMEFESNNTLGFANKKVQIVLSRK